MSLVVVRPTTIEENQDTDWGFVGGTIPTILTDGSGSTYARSGLHLVDAVPGDPESEQVPSNRRLVLNIQPMTVAADSRLLQYRTRAKLRAHTDDTHTRVEFEFIPANNAHPRSTRNRSINMDTVVRNSPWVKPGYIIGDDANLDAFNDGTFRIKGERGDNPIRMVETWLDFDVRAQPILSDMELFTYIGSDPPDYTALDCGDTLTGSTVVAVRANSAYGYTNCPNDTYQRHQWGRLFRKDQYLTEGFTPWSDGVWGPPVVEKRRTSQSPCNGTEQLMAFGSEDYAHFGPLSNGTYRWYMKVGTGDFIPINGNVWWSEDQQCQFDVDVEAPPPPDIRAKVHSCPPRVALVIRNADVIPADPDSPWRNMQYGSRRYSHTVNHVINLDFTPLSGSLLVVVACSTSTNTVTGWTERLETGDSNGHLNVFTKFSTGSETTVTVTHADDMAALEFIIYEFESGSLYMQGNAGPLDNTTNFTEMTSIPASFTDPMVVFAVIGRPGANTEGAIAARSWQVVTTEHRDHLTKGRSDVPDDLPGVWLAAAHRTNYQETTVLPKVTAPPTSDLYNPGDLYTKAIFVIEVPTLSSSTTWDDVDDVRIQVQVTWDSGEHWDNVVAPGNGARLGIGPDDVINIGDRFIQTSSTVDNPCGADHEVIRTGTWRARFYGKANDGAFMVSRWTFSVPSVVPACSQWGHCNLWLIHPRGPEHDWTGIDSETSFDTTRPFAVGQPVAGGLPTVVSGEPGGQNFAMKFVVRSTADMQALMEALKSPVLWLVPDDPDLYSIWVAPGPDTSHITLKVPTTAGVMWEITVPMTQTGPPHVDLRNLHDYIPPV